MQMPTKPEHLTELRHQEAAVEIIKAGLQSGSISLKGSANASDTSVAGKRDAEYLAALLQGLVTALSKNKMQ